MSTMAPIHSTELQLCRIRLRRGPVAVPEARSHVRAAIRSWDVPVDPDTAILLTSELVTNAVRNEVAGSIVLAISCSRGHFRVDVHDTSCSLPVMADAPADSETGRGLMLVDSLSAEWGFYRTPSGKAVYFTLACHNGVASKAVGRGPRGHARGDGEP